MSNTPQQSTIDIRLVEVGPRDGLQNESAQLDVDDKIHLIDLLSECGFQNIESASFVSPKWVPQMANSGDVMQGITRKPGVTYSALTPNTRGLEDALTVNSDEVAVFAAVTETFSQRNTNCSIADSLQRIETVVKKSLAANTPVRGYLSCVLGCPYEGKVNTDVVLEMAERLLEFGCYEISLGDTIGVGTPTDTAALIKTLASHLPVAQLAVHFHDTYGQALANIHAVLPLGVTVIDTSIAGLGGCPYAKGASGNVATEDVVYMLDGMNLKTGLDMSALLQANRFITDKLGRSGSSRAAAALISSGGSK